VPPAAETFVPDRVAASVTGVLGGTEIQPPETDWPHWLLSHPPDLAVDFDVDFDDIEPDQHPHELPLPPHVLELPQPGWDVRVVVAEVDEAPPDFTVSNSLPQVLLEAALVVSPE
jgi:hypothetical protein